MNADLPDTYWVSHPKAKQPHRCCECRGTISPGETYERYQGVWSGDFSTYKTCTDCLELRSIVTTDGWEFGQMYDEVFERDDLIPVFNAIRLKRGAPESPNRWMERRGEDLLMQPEIPQIT